jgi:serine/threonine protein kinase
VAVKRAASRGEVEMHLLAGWHDNVVNLRGLAHHNGHTYLVMEMCPRGTLDLLVHQSSSHRLEPSKLLPIVRAVARGMLHLHTRSPPILHRDLKPGNIFIGHGYLMKVGDFGMARPGVPTPRQGSFDDATADLHRTLTPGVIGTAVYCAPELLLAETPKAGAAAPTSERLLKADVYSFGVTVWEVMERKRPYAGMDGFQVQTQWLLDPESMKLQAPTVPPGLSGPAKTTMETLSKLVERCTSWEPDDRPSFKEVLAMLRTASGGDAAGQGGVTPRMMASPF